MLLFVLDLMPLNGFNEDLYGLSNFIYFSDTSRLFFNPLLKIYLKAIQ